MLDVETRELRRGAEPIAVEPQVFDLLVYLVLNRDRVVSKDDLIGSVWGGRIVSDSTLTSRINAARKAVGDSGKDQRLIRTIARKGLRFVGAVRTQSNGEEATDVANAPQDDLREPLRPALPPSDRPAIAVLPFVNMSDDPAQEYFSDGISEDLITALSKLRWFFVIARNSSFIYKGKAVHMRRVAEELGVGYVVEGSVRKIGDRVRITVQLNNVATGSHIWAERYDRSLDDVFALQDEITEAIVWAIEPQLYAAENFRAQRKPPDSMDAWDLVMRALSHYWRVTRQDNVVAQALLEKAIAIDPAYGQALGLLAACHTFSAHMGWEDMAIGVPIAECAALAAIQADSEDPWAHHALGSVYLFTRRFEDSLAEFELALRLNPNFLLAQGYYGLGDLVLHREHVGEAAVVAFRPDVPAGRDVVELYSDAHAVATLADTALDHIANAEVLGDLSQMDGLILVDERRIAGDHEEPAKLGQRGDDVFTDAVGKIFLLRIAAHIEEGKHRDGRPIRRRPSWA